MDPDFWHDRWRKKEIAFHEGAFNALLVQHFPQLSLREGAGVFVPLCGKTRDIAWLLEAGYRVTGAELSEIAVEELFAELGLTPVVTQDGALTRYASVALIVFVGDIFALDAPTLGAVDAVYDRAALVALPGKMRSRYARHVTQITARAPQLVITYTYDQDAMAGPPFSVTPEMMTSDFAAAYDIEKVGTVDIPALKGKATALESAWLLRPKAQDSS